MIVEAGAILERSTVRGPAIVGAGARLTDAYIGPYTAVGRHCVVESAEVEHSILLEGSSVRGLDGRMESSLLGRDVHITPQRPPAARLPVHGRGLVGDRDPVAAAYSPRMNAIVVGTDGSPGAEAAIQKVIELTKGSGATIHLVCAYPAQHMLARLGLTGSSESVDLRGVAADVVARDEHRFTDAGFTVEKHAREGDPAHTLLDVAKEQDADLIVDRRARHHRRAAVQHRRRGGQALPPHRHEPADRPLRLAPLRDQDQLPADVPFLAEAVRFRRLGEREGRARSGTSRRPASISAVASVERPRARGPRRRR